MDKHKIQPRVLSAGQTRKPDNFFYRFFSSQRFLAMVGLVFILLIIFPLAKVYTQKRIVEKEINEVKEEIAVFEKTNQDLRQMIDYLQSDQSLEEQARLNLNMKKPGEQVVVIENLPIATTADEINKNTTSESNFKKWWNYFFG
ncbi:septum formation initiator family protein [Candidatus Falkowbacteria bacterium]|jgi:cell division protein FtsB|nr:septum formation initiator family protein [Candidatus Falkowbacteria bacterium]